MGRLRKGSEYQVRVAGPGGRPLGIQDPIGRVCKLQKVGHVRRRISNDVSSGFPYVGQVCRSLCDFFWLLLYSFFGTLAVGMGVDQKQVHANSRIFEVENFN
jgi:hypothetical protein